MHAGYGVQFIVYIVLATVLTIADLCSSTAVCIIVESNNDDCNRLLSPAIQVSDLSGPATSPSSLSLISVVPYHPKSEFQFSKRSFKTVSSL